MSYLKARVTVGYTDKPLFTAGVYYHIANQTDSHYVIVSDHGKTKYIKFSEVGEGTGKDFTYHHISWFRALLNNFWR